MNSGLILFDKPTGITSFDALRDIKRALGTGKVGHTGTLDKFACGLLIVLVGRALKLSRWFTNCDKKYEGRIQFGAETDTLDPEGNVIAQAALPQRDDVEKVLSRFTGEILQAPPVYSAIHIDGKRASNLARSGAVVEMKKRQVFVYSLELLSWEPPFADIFVHCSSGTYIRSLARDIALEVGSRAHLSALKRTAVGEFTTNKSEPTRTFKNDNVINISKSVITALGMPFFDVCEREKQHIIHGKPLDNIINDKFIREIAAVFCEEELIAVLEKSEDKWKYGCVM